MDINSYLSAVVSGIAVIQAINMWRAKESEKRKQEIDKKLSRVLDKFDKEVELIRATTVNVNFCNARHAEVNEVVACLRADVSALRGAHDANCQNCAIK